MEEETTVSPSTDSSTPVANIDTAVENQSSQVEQTDNEQVNEAPVEEATSTTEEEVQPETPEAQAEDLTELEIPDFMLEMQNQNVPDVPQFDVTQLPTDEQGNVRPEAFNQAINGAIQAAIAAAVGQSTAQTQITQLETREWNSALTQFPQLKDPKVRGMVKAIRNQSVMDSGGKGYLSPTKAAEQLFGALGQAKQEGIKSAQTQTRIQKSATLESATSSTPTEGSRKAELRQRMSSSNPEEARSARREMIKEMIRDGQIQVNR
jgi:hypothetical protein